MELTVVMLEMLLEMQLVGSKFEQHLAPSQGGVFSRLYLRGEYFKQSLLHHVFRDSDAPAAAL